MVVITCFSALCIQWRTEAKNQLIACMIAQNYLEKATLNTLVPGTIQKEEGKYSIKIITEQHTITTLPYSDRALPLYTIMVIVLWVNDKGNEQVIGVQTAC